MTSPKEEDFYDITGEGQNADEQHIESIYRQQIKCSDDGIIMLFKRQKKTYDYLEKTNILVTSVFSFNS